MLQSTGSQRVRHDSFTEQHSEYLHHRHCQMLQIRASPTRPLSCLLTGTPLAVRIQGTYLD